MSSRAARVGTLALFALLGGGSLSACDPSTTSRQAQIAAPSAPTSQAFGDYEVHYNAVRTDMLTAEVARAYKIERSANRVLLNVSMLRRGPDGRLTPVDGSTKATAHNLNGQVKGLDVRRITEGESVYFIGEVGITGNEILVFNIDATPADQAETFTVQFKREFFAD